MARWSKFVVAAAAAVLPASAIADTTYVYEEQKPMGGVGVAAEIGVNNFARNSADDLINPGVAYGAGLDLRPQRNVGVELGYQGAFNSLKSSVSTDGAIVSNKVGGNLRLNAVPPDRELPANLTPFVFGGAAYSRFDTNDFAPGFKDNVNAFSIPVGAGLEADIGRFLLGARFTWNFNLNNANILPTGQGTDNWLVTANLGARFGS